MRKSKPKKRYYLPDPIYKDALVTQFVNNLMLDGKKSISYSIFYDSLKIVEEKTKEKGLELWKKALSNVMPSVEVKSRRVGGRVGGMVRSGRFVRGAGAVHSE